jgi:hypothetical protein
VPQLSASAVIDAPAATLVNVHIHVKFGKRRIFLEGSGDATVLEYLTCHKYSEQLLLLKTPSEMRMYLKQDARILRSGTTFAEVIPSAFPTFFTLNLGLGIEADLHCFA